MIIYLTVHDNDFGNLMARFASNLNHRIQFYNPFPPYEEMKDNPQLLKEAVDHRIAHEELMKRVYRAVSGMDSETKEAFCDVVTKCFEHYLTTVDWSDYNSTADTAEYLTKYFSVDIVPSFEDEWDNGESFYYVTSNNKFINV